VTILVLPGCINSAVVDSGSSVFEPILTTGLEVSAGVQQGLYIASLLASGDELGMPLADSELVSEIQNADTVSEPVASVNFETETFFVDSAVDVPEVKIETTVEEPASESGASEEISVDPEVSVDKSSSTKEKKSEQAKSDNSDKIKTDSVEEKQISVTLTVSSPVGGSYSVLVNDKATIEEVMQAARAQGFSYTLKSFSGLGGYVEALGGVSEDTAAGMYWIVYVNGAPAIAGISAMRVSEGALIHWSYEKSF